ncbi:MAG TPA: FAD binding domain-containing protein [Vicinamibacterales bacterium]|nr:FAD binding domain-containing protein [Vicinamibacterales bacterium]
MSSIQFLLNGQPVLVDNPAPQLTLLDFIRARGLTGAKEGCAEGECGACAVALVEPENGRSAYRVANSCLMFLPMAAGRELYTVESLAAAGELCEAQRAMAAGGGSQCGYCTPGFVVSLFAEQHRPGRSGPCDTMALAGNLCRCTGYRPIRDAAHSLGPAPNSGFLERLSRPAPGIAGFGVDGFSRPSTIDECLAILKSDPAAKLVAGGTDVAVESNLRASRWAHLVSLEAIDTLKEFSSTPERVSIGAGLPLEEIGRRWADAPEVFREWLTQFGSPLVRNRATLGGNLATASPVGDAAPLLLALDALVHVAGPSGRRAIPLAGFFTGYRKTALVSGEIIVAIEIPKPLPQSVRFYKIAKRRLDDISTVAAGMAIDLDGSHVRRARFAFGGVAATPLRVIDAEESVANTQWNEAAVGRVQRVLDRSLKPMSDHRGSKEYRLEVSKSLVEKYWWEQRS